MLVKVILYCNFYASNILDIFYSSKQVIKDYQLFIVVGVLLTIDLAIMTTWQIADPFYRATKQMDPYVSLLLTKQIRPLLLRVFTYKQP